MVDVLENLKKKIIDDDQVKNSVLGFADTWKSNHYEILSEIINERLSEKITHESEAFFSLGNSISPVTLKRIFEGQVKSTAYNDLRFLKTLEKLCIFLNYNNLNVFISIHQSQQEKSHSIENLQEFELAKKIILKGAELEFVQMCNTPNFDFSVFDNIIVNGSPYRKRIELYLTKLMVPDLKLEKELSNFEIYNYQLKTLENNLMIIDTDELWTLIFSKDGNHFPYHKKGQQTYYLKKIDAEWLIWDNYNPDLEDIIKTRKPPE